MKGKDTRGQRWLLKAENTAIKLIEEDQREGVVTIEKAQWAKAKRLLNILSMKCWSLWELSDSTELGLFFAV